MLVPNLHIGKSGLRSSSFSLREARDSLPRSQARAWEQAKNSYLHLR